MSATTGQASLLQLSRFLSLVMLTVYFCYLTFELKTHAGLFEDEPEQPLPSVQDAVRKSLFPCMVVIVPRKLLRSLSCLWFVVYRAQNASGAQVMPLDQVRSALNLLDAMIRSACH